jgi:hypothetical protein
MSSPLSIPYPVRMSSPHHQSETSARGIHHPCHHKPHRLPSPSSPLYPLHPRFMTHQSEVRLRDVTAPVLIGSAKALHAEMERCNGSSPAALREALSGLQAIVIDEVGAWMHTHTPF